MNKFTKVLEHLNSKCNQDVIEDDYRIYLYYGFYEDGKGSFDDLSRVLISYSLESTDGLIYDCNIRKNNFLYNGYRLDISEYTSGKTEFSEEEYFFLVLNVKEINVFSFEEMKSIIDIASILK